MTYYTPYFSRRPPTLVNAMDFGAVGDNVTDDTAALQAAIDFGFANGVNVYIPRGTYITTAQLTVGTNSSAGRLVEGWKIFGDGPGHKNNAGTCIILNAIGVDAIMQVNSGAWRWLEISDLTLFLQVGSSASYGLLFNSTEFSQHTVSRVGIGGIVSGPSVAFGVLRVTGENGEFILFDDCYAEFVDKFYYTNSGQALIPNFRHCRCFTLNVGGIHFYFDLTGETGGGANIFDYNATASLASGISNSTLIYDEGNSSVINMIGGRLENVTQLYFNPAGNTDGSFGVGGLTTIKGMEIVIDYDATNGALTKTNVLVEGGNGNIISVQNCIFQALVADATFPVQWGRQGWHVVKFSDCRFFDFCRPPYSVTHADSIDASLIFDNCRTNGTAVFNSTATAVFPLDRAIDVLQLATGRRRIDHDTAWMQGGLPDNQIVNPQIATSNGGAVTPVSPWQTSGSSSTIKAEDWNGSPQPRSYSQFARYLEIGATSSLYQDIASADLSSGSIAKYNMLGTSFAFVTWQLLINFLGGSTNGAFSIVDSVSGQVYDSWEYITAGIPTCPRIITLTALVQQKGSTSYPQIRIDNLGPNTLFMDISWQFVGVNHNSSFGPFTSATTLEQEASVSESLILSAPMNLAYIDDSYGATATNPLPNLAGKIYMSSTDNKLTLHDGTGWRKL